MPVTLEMTSVSFEEAAHIEHAFSGFCFLCLSPRFQLTRASGNIMILSKKAGRLSCNRGSVCRKAVIKPLTLTH